MGLSPGVVVHQLCLERQLVHQNKNRNMSSKQEKEQEWNMAIKVENAAAKSGNGTIEGVGIKADGKFKSPVTNQCFDTQEALDLHLKYLHDPKKAPAVEE